MPIRFACLLAVVAACGGPGAGAPPETVANRSEEPPAAVEPAPATVAAAPGPDSPLCCCTFSFAEDVDYPDVNTWDAIASVCATGDANRMPGKCISWQWCDYAPGQEPRTLADRPDLTPPPPLAASECCCDIFQNGGETFHVLDTVACLKTRDAACVDAGFCGVSDGT
jgi:hypothetical protein